MKRNIVIILLLCSACAPVSARLSATSASAASPQAQASPQLVTRTPEVTPTETATPTIDYQSTTIAAQATSDAARLQAVQINATASAEALQATASAFSLNLTADTDNRQAGAVSQSIRSTQAIEIATIQASGFTATAHAPTQAAAMTAATFTGLHEATGIGVQWVLILLAAVCAVYLISAAWRNWRVPIDYNYALGAPVAAPLPPLERAAIPLPSGSLDLDTMPPGDADKFTELCRYALEGKPLGFGNVVHAGVYGSNAQYAPVREWMAKKEYYAPSQSGGTTLSKSGTAFCTDWVNSHQEEA